MYIYIYIYIDLPRYRRPGDFQGEGVDCILFSESSGFGEGSTDTSDMAWNDALRKQQSCKAKRAFGRSLQGV